jgi:hypothetical protein
LELLFVPLSKRLNRFSIYIFEMPAIGIEQWRSIASSRKTEALYI